MFFCIMSFIVVSFLTDLVLLISPAIVDLAICLSGTPRGWGCYDFNLFASWFLLNFVDDLASENGLTISYARISEDLS